jgi:hypothetical protein
MDSVALSGDPIHLGLDVSKNKIAMGILRWDKQVPDTEMLINDEPSVRGSTTFIWRPVAGRWSTRSRWCAVVVG